jgi:hypothetical protein
MTTVHSSTPPPPDVVFLDAFLCHRRGVAENEVWETVRSWLAHFHRRNVAVVLVQHAKRTDEPAAATAAGKGGAS